MTTSQDNAYGILIAALGGEGGGVLADWLVQCARLQGLPVQATSVPGVAQRTGATSYYIEMLREPVSGPETPVFGLTPVAGRVDVLVASDADASEFVDPAVLPVAPGAIVWTQGAAGGRYARADGSTGRWDAAPLPGPPVDSYGCGDSFVAGLTVGLARGLDLDGALALGARCGAACLTGRGALAPQLVEA